MVQIIQQVFDLVVKMGKENQTLEGKIVRWVTAISYSAITITFAFCACFYLIDKTFY